MMWSYAMWSDAVGHREVKFSPAADRAESRRPSATFRNEEHHICVQHSSSRHRRGSGATVCPTNLSMRPPRIGSVHKMPYRFSMPQPERRGVGGSRCTPTFVLGRRRRPDIDGLTSHDRRAERTQRKSAIRTDYGNYYCVSPRVPYTSVLIPDNSCIRFKFSIYSVAHQKWKNLRLLAGRLSGADKSVGRQAQFVSQERLALSR
jgi:hypothetical protein